MEHRGNPWGQSRDSELGHTQRPKVLRWPGRKAVIGYVGAAQVGGIPTDEWLYDFIGRHFEFRILRLWPRLSGLRLKLSAERMRVLGTLKH